MKDKPLDRAERALLTVIREIDDKRGGVDRDRLSVMARGRGLEVARPLASLVDRGLIEEIHRRPLLLARVFGARPALLFRLTPSGLAAAAETDPAAEPEMGASGSIAPVVEPPAAGIGEPEPDPAGPDPVAAPPANPLKTGHSPVEDTAPAKAARAVGGPARAARPDRRNLAAFTEDLGGAPVSAGGVSLSHGVEPEVMEGLRDVLAGLGMELTFAGEALVGDRIARGETAGEALSQVVLFAFAHAAREDMASGGALAALGFGEYAGEVAAELKKLNAAGLIDADRCEAVLSRIVVLAGDDAARDQVVAEILADPVGGLLPPALVPEELRPAGDS
ncbi:hypothetical protein NHN26_14070 [Rhodovulum tesquicola]|uniref:hypothetical protein n=1 Tax=Rhodovulum tesquicola TaxID=540254 RepID=UPI0020968749|nr:hypothetical protein [Rhodovulum tesquicola]MCO8146351.1 hypothetical protein [Rhodovulum tesquicola]